MKPKLSSSQHQWQDNIVKAEDFIYNNNSIDDLIIGSSLSCRFVMDSLPHFYNLSFGGQSIFDGLKIIKQTEKFPKNIYIETNVLLKKESNEFTNSLFSVIPYLLKKHLLSLRTNKQPIPIFIEYFTCFKNKTTAFLMPQKNIIENKSIGQLENTSIKKTDLFNKMLTLQIDNYSKQPDSSLLDKQSLLLLEYVRYFKDHGVNVSLFEMPVNYNLIELMQSQIIRNKIHELFPKDKIDYFLPDSSKYETTDGVHLNGEEALRYTIYFRNQLKSR